MGKKTQITEIVVRVDVPKPWLTSSDEQWKRDARDIESAIRRHVDNIGYVSIDVVTESVCEHYGYEWEEDENGSPQCCQACIDEWEAKKKDGDA